LGHNFIECYGSGISLYCSSGGTPTSISMEAPTIRMTGTLTGTAISNYLNAFLPTFFLF
jgi:hypothetical protein